MITIWELESLEQGGARRGKRPKLACVAELLGERARSMGLRCPCPKCQDAGFRIQEPVLPDFKMRQAHDDTSL